MHYLGKDPVKQPRRTTLSAAELDACLARLSRWDAEQAWTQHTLQMIEDHPGRRAAELAPQVNFALPVFKRKVRQLKGLGLTESLEVGYRLSDRGRQVLRSLQQTK